VRVEASNSFPRLFSRGSIEATRKSHEGTTGGTFPRLFSRGSIEAKVVWRDDALVVEISAAVQPRLH